MRALDLHDGTISYDGVAESWATNDGSRAFSRLPRRDSAIFGPIMGQTVATPSGVRARLRTDSTRLVVRLDAPVVTFMGMAEQPTPTITDLLVDGEPHPDELGQVRADGDPADARWIHEFTLPGRDVDLEIWLPTRGRVAIVGIEVDNGARVAPPTFDDRPRWVHYGSSISQCAEAHSPLRTWPAIAARLGGWHLTNLGFGGSCHLDQFVARHMAGLPADRLSIKIGINIVSAMSYTQRTFPSVLHGFLDTLRDGHPETPLIVCSSIVCPPIEASPGPVRFDASGKFVTDAAPSEDAFTLRWLRASMRQAVELRVDRGDGNLTYIDGLDLFSESDRVDLPDDMHPNGDGYERIAARWRRLVDGG